MACNKCGHTKSSPCACKDTPLETITKLEPDIIVKGGDYTFDTVVGNHLAKVVIFPTVEGHSTTRIINEDINYRT